MRTNIVKMTYTAILIACGIALPFAFHAIPEAGKLISPMHIPVLLCGLICGFPCGMCCGILTTLLSSLLTGMPGPASLPAMLCELAVYGLVSSLLMQFVRTKNLYLDIYISLLGAMLSGRIVYGVLNSLIFSAGRYSLQIWATSAFVTAIPGIIIQVIAIPVIVLALQKARLIESRY